jgi:uncharacterized protein YbbC (DUF1343 family)
LYKVLNQENKLLLSMRNSILVLLLLTSFSGGCQLPYKTEKTPIILPGAYQIEQYLPNLAGKRVAIVANNTSMVNKTHLVDTLKSLGITIEKIFGPEHGFRGNQPDGKEINNSVDAKTGIEIISLFGDHKKPTKDDLTGIDVVVFDIQDVGARFYTYISTLTYVMEACSENNIPLIVLDRPNPNGFYVDGPMLDPSFASFVGMHTVPIVYGMTIGEYATMVNGEKWLSAEKQCKLTVIKCKNYTHNSHYQLPLNPSPNLQDMKAIYLYPSLCLFEGTVVSVGRGTDSPFKVYGHPKLPAGTYTFTPKPIIGISEDPPLKFQVCNGQNLSNASELISKKGHIELSWLIDSYKKLKTSTVFFTNYFDKLAGSKTLREQIIVGKSESEIRKSWQTDLVKFKKIRKKYLLYADFE